jgi:hypothetical protein
LLDSFSGVAVLWLEAAATLGAAAADAQLGSKAAEPSRTGVAEIHLYFSVVA